MSIIPCSLCHQAFCTCVRPTDQPFAPPFTVTQTPTIGTLTLPAHLSDEQVDRIAKRVVELLDARKPTPINLTVVIDEAIKKALADVFTKKPKPKKRRT